MRTIVLVEGISDRIAVETLAARWGRDLKAERISVVPIGGAQAVSAALERFAHARVTGLCDVGEERHFRRALERAGFGPARNRDDLERLGFFVCVEDLEDELIRALGPARVEAVIDAHGDLGPFRTLQKQPAWQGRPVEQQLRRFMGSGGRRKTRYARYLVEALDLDRVPRPLDGLIGHL